MSKVSSYFKQEKRHVDRPKGPQAAPVPAARIAQVCEQEEYTGLESGE
jgi:hypothetical protein